MKRKNELEDFSFIDSITFCSYFFLIIYGILTYTKSTPDSGVTEANLILGIVYFTPVVLLILFFHNRNFRDDQAKGFLYSSFFWLFMAISTFTVCRGFVSF